MALRTLCWRILALIDVSAYKTSEFLFHNDIDGLKVMIIIIVPAVHRVHGVPSW